MTKEKIIELISQGEGVTIEFKECKNEITAEVYPTVCSFANRFGGHILMGVADDGEVLGVNPKCVKDMKKNLLIQRQVKKRLILKCLMPLTAN